MKTREEQIQERLDQIPVSCQRTYEIAVGKKSMRAAVNAFCQECVGYSREEIHGCSDKGCPLWAYRPYQTLQKAQRRRFSDQEATTVL